MFVVFMAHIISRILADLNKPVSNQLLSNDVLLITARLTGLIQLLVAHGALDYVRALVARGRHTVCLLEGIRGALAVVALTAVINRYGLGLLRANNTQQFSNSANSASSCSCSRHGRGRVANSEVNSPAAVGRRGDNHALGHLLINGHFIRFLLELLTA